MSSCPEQQAKDEKGHNLRSLRYGVSTGERLTRGFDVQVFDDLPVDHCHTFTPPTRLVKCRHLATRQIDLVLRRRKDRVCDRQLRWMGTSPLIAKSLLSARSTPIIGKRARGFIGSA